MWGRWLDKEKDQIVRLWSSEREEITYKLIYKIYVVSCLLLVKKGARPHKSVWMTCRSRVTWERERMKDNSWVLTLLQSVQIKNYKSEEEMFSFLHIEVMREKNCVRIFLVTWSLINQESCENLTNSWLLIGTHSVNFWIYDQLQWHRDSVIDCCTNMRTRTIAYLHSVRSLIGLSVAQGINIRCHMSRNIIIQKPGSRWWWCSGRGT
jgi:hypothetical protein